MKHQTGYFTASDGMQLFEQQWLPEKITAVIIIIHGYMEHSSRYAHVAEFLTKQGFAVHTYDQRGHGKSPGQRAYVNSFDEYLNDVDLFLKKIKEQHENMPLFLFGHSMGGLIVTLYMISRKPEIQGILLSGAVLKISDDISPLLVKMSGFIGAILPQLPTIQLDSNALSRDPEVVNRYNTDPLVCRSKIPARTGAEINRATKLVQENMEQVELPLLIMHGTADRLSDPLGSKQLHERAHSRDKTIKLFDGFYHEILNEPGKETVMAEMAQWLDRLTIRA